MKNQELFNRTHAILTEAYLNDTLQHGNYCGCAVGNLVAADQNCRPYKTPFGVKWEEGSGSAWFAVVVSRVPHTKELERLGYEQVASTGYSVEELQLIEEAFEDGAHEAMAHLKEPQFAGLCAVFETLSHIHEMHVDDRSELNSLFYENKFALTV